MTLEELFNSREIALGLWASVLLIWALTQSKLQRNLCHIAKVALKMRLLFPVAVFAGYFSLILVMLWAIGYWQFEMIKETIYWFALSGLALFGRAVTESTPLEDWRQTVRGQVSIIVILAFLVNSYTFSIYAEIILVPAVVLISLLAAYAEHQHQNEPVNSLLKGLQTFVGLVILFFAGMNAYHDYAELASIGTIKGLLLPVVLATMVIPYIYFIALYSAYDRIFRIGISGQSPKMASYIKKKILRSGGLRLRKARLISNISPYEFRRANDKEDVDAVIQRHLAGKEDPSETSGD